MTAPEFSRPIRLDRIGGVAVVQDISASADECAAVARRFGLISVEALKAHVSARLTGAGVTLEGRVEAAVTQACVASGEPVAAIVAEDFALRYVAPQDGLSEEEVEIDADALDIVEHDGTSIDAGEAVAQTLGLALDPFPRSAGAGERLKAAGVLSEEQAGPFAALAALRPKQ